ncbi:hypothetical protein BB560_002207 [Smittium megazygosporum]|uniref:Uncharacterized protein n=1 Tax=Smittium megazygosporum TaxID=133381 RepID=A0A2T9ZFF9_9FUNG|nr:hypothetical protein BB560_002207 [Smittium megazygosporum]
MSRDISEPVAKEHVQKNIPEGIRISSHDTVSELVSLNIEADEHISLSFNSGKQYPSPIESKRVLKLGSLKNLCGTLSFQVWIPLHRFDCFRKTSSISSFVPNGTTGNIYLKSPEKTIIFSLNSNSVPVTPLSNLSATLRLLLFVIEHSSQIITLLALNYGS